MDIFVYIIKNETGMVKVGISVDPKRRMATLQTSSGSQLTVCSTYEMLDLSHARSVERDAHTILAPYRKRGEWFECSEAVAAASVAKAMRVTPAASAMKLVTVNVKGVRAKTWQAAKVAAANCGMSMGMFIASVINERIELEAVGKWTSPNDGNP